MPTTALVNYSQQINAAHQACLAAKELGGKKAHECGTWLLKQKEAVPHGQWLPWLAKNCAFKHAQASRYMAVATLNFSSVRNLSLQDALWEVAQQKAEEAEIDEEIAAGKRKPYKPSKSDERVFQWVKAQQERKEYINSLGEKERVAYQKAEEDQRVAERTALKDLKGVAAEIVKAGYRELAKQYHPDMGGSSEDMRKLTDAKKELDYLVQTKWRKS